MSKKESILIIAPPTNMIGEKHGEVLKFKDFDCPKCGGSGGFSHTGWSAKFKKNINDPDWETCTDCNGVGRLDANVVIGWVSSEKRT